MTFDEAVSKNIRVRSHEEVKALDRDTWQLAIVPAACEVIPAPVQGGVGSQKRREEEAAAKVVLRSFGRRWQ